MNNQEYKYLYELEPVYLDPAFYCLKCGTKLEMTDGWYPSYNNPDNHNLDPVSELHCPKCEIELEHAGLPLDIIKK